MQRTFTEPQKKIVAARQQWACSMCGVLLPSTFQVDHTVALCDGGEDDYETNATAMCPNCHARKTQLETIARKRASVCNTPLYEDRVDFIVPGGMLRCSLCGNLRKDGTGHPVCSEIEAPGTRHKSLTTFFAQFAYKPKFDVR